MNLAVRLWYRSFQFGFYKAQYLLKWRKPMVLLGAGSLEKLPEALRSFKVDNVLVVTDSGLAALYPQLLDLFKREGIDYSLFDRVKPNPTVSLAEAVREAYLINGCNGLVAFGGGSPIDTAKAAAARIARPRKSIADMRGFLKVGRKVPPLFAVPTTAGTGSEVTIAAVITDDNTHHKYAVCDPQLIPVCAVLDPLLTAGLPPHITAATGMDALTHAVEAYITRHVSKRCKKLCEDAVGLIFSNIEEVYTNGGDLDARQNMLLAAFYAGDAFTRCGLTYVHPIAHALGGLYNETHGRANAAILPYVLETFGSGIHQKLAILAKAAGLEVSDKTEAEAAAAFIAAIRQLNKTFGIPQRFESIKQQDIKKIVKWAMEEANPWYPVPKLMGEEELTAIVRQIEKEANA